MLERVEKRLQKLINIDIDAVLLSILSDKDLQQFIIELNTKGQLFDKGIDSLSVSLGDYAATTIEGTVNFKGKKDKGQRFDHITLSDTETFYDSWVITLGGKSFLFKITANPNRGKSNLFDDFGEEILGLTKENLQIVIDAIREKILAEIRLQIQMAAEHFRLNHPH